MGRVKMRQMLYKVFNVLQREFLRRSMPHGLISPRYFLPFQPLRVRFHRRFWLRALPRIPLFIYLPMEGWLYLRWVLFYAWRFSFRAVSHRGPGIRDREGLGIVSQFIRVLSMAILYCVPPPEIYAFRLYRPDRHMRVWDYVFTHEVSAFHRWRDSLHGKRGESVRILGDKERTAEILSQRGLPVVPILDFRNPGAQLNLSHLLKSYSRLFLKPRRGSAGRGCFVAKRDEKRGDLKVFETRAGMIMKRASEARLLEHIAREPYLVQPMCINHPDLSELCQTRDAVTVRIITEAPGKKRIRFYSAFLEIPGPEVNPKSRMKANPDKRGHTILPIDCFSGRTIAWETSGLPSVAEKAYGKCYKMAENKMIPFWKSMQQNALAAHEVFRDVYAVAWDFVISPDGPYLLEGNTSWGTRMPQIVHGGLLRDPEGLSGFSSIS